MNTIYFQKDSASIKNEDRMVYFQVDSGYVWTIFDGHAGFSSAEACAQNVEKIFNLTIRATTLERNYPFLFQTLFDALHNECKRYPESGTTATLLFFKNKTRKFHVAAVGDSPLYRCTQQTAFDCFQIPTWQDPANEKNACNAWERFQTDHNITSKTLPLMSYWETADTLKKDRRFLPVFYKQTVPGIFKECILNDLDQDVAKACGTMSRIVMPTSLGDNAIAQYGAPSQQIVYNSFFLDEKESLVLCSDGICCPKKHLFPPQNPSEERALSYVRHLVATSLNKIKDDASAFFIYWGKEQ